MPNGQQRGAGGLVHLLSKRTELKKIDDDHCVSGPLQVNNQGIATQFIPLNNCFRNISKHCNWRDETASLPNQWLQGFLL